MRRWMWLGLIGLALAVPASLVARAYARDMARHDARLLAGGRVVQTGCGAMQTAESGPADGPPLLVVHGAGGGYDQGLTLGREYAEAGYRVIAPSRFGYLRTPMPADASGEHQADHLACLLDALDLPQVAVMGVSAGGISALHLAARHPQRTRALVLVVPAVYRPDATVPMPRWALWLLDRIVARDLAFWALMKLAPDVLRRLVLATPPAEYERADDEDRARADLILEQILPLSRRRAGLLNDSRLTTGAARAPLEAIRAPTLVISARDDGFGTYASAQYSAEHIAGARFVGFERGGHLLLGHRQAMAEAVKTLLETASWTPRRKPAEGDQAGIMASPR